MWRAILCAVLVMASKPEQLELQVAREASLIEKLDRAFARELATVLRFTDRRTRELLEELRAKEGRLVATKANLGRVLGLRKDLIDVFDEAGFEALAEAATDEPLNDLADLVLRGNRIAQRAFDFSKLDLEAIAAFKTVRFEELLGLEEQLAVQLQRVVLDGTIGLRPLDELVTDVADLFDVSDRQARTLYDTAISMYARQVDQLHATGKPEELFYYAGPLDVKTRAFCRARVGRVFTREELETADNGQLPNPLLTGGGFNCRHVAKRVSVLDDELQELAGTKKRAPHVQEILNDLRKAAA